MTRWGGLKFDPVKRTHYFNMRVNEDEQAALDRLARYHGCTTADLIRQLVRRESVILDRDPLHGRGSYTLRVDPWRGD